MTSFYTPERVGELLASIGDARLGPYLVMAGGDRRRALDLYTWNLSLGAAFFAPLAILEVTVRNAFHAQLRELFGANWPDDPRFVAAAERIGAARFPINSPTQRVTFNTDLRADINKAKLKITKDLIKKAGTPPRVGARLVPTVDDIVASLDFGYWTSLLNRDVEPVLYAAGLYKVFPRAPHVPGKTPARGKIAWRINEVRQFRNRVMHHEPLFNRKDLRDDLRYIVQVCRWTGTCAGDWIEHVCRLEDVLRARPRREVAFRPSAIDLK